MEEEIIATTEGNDFVLENLKPGTSYEAFVAAENALGVGDNSIRIVFR